MTLDIRAMTPLLQVFDMPTSLHFYRDLLGFEIVEHSPAWEHYSSDCVDWVWLRHGTVDLMLNTAYERDSRPEAADKARSAAHDDAALYLGCPGLDEAFRYLQGCGLDVQPPEVRHYGVRQLSLHDPDGYHLCFQWKV